MQSSHAKKASITLPADIERDLKKLARAERRTLSGVIQEASRYYLSVKKYEELQRELALIALRSGVRDEESVGELIHHIRSKHK